MADGRVTRRNFLKYALFTLSGMTAALGSRCFFKYVAEKRKWVGVGPVSKFRLQKPEKVRAGAQDVWVVKVSESEFFVYHPLCTHHDCFITWKEKESLFFCPCHGATFNIKGDVLSGPPPRPLDRYPSKVADGNLFVGFASQG